MSPKNQKDAPFSAQPDAGLKTDIVENIPLHQAAAQPTPVSEAENIDGIMKDVSKEVKKVDEAPPKHHLFGHKEKPALAGHHPLPAAAPPSPAPASAPMPRQPAPAAPKHEAKSSKPVMVIIFTLIIIAFLIVAAISAYKK